MELNKVYLGNSEKLISEIQDKTVDVIITDPPYLYLNHKLDVPLELY